MSRVLLGLSACVLGLLLTGEASAHPVRVAHRGRVAHRPYYARHGVRFAGGYYAGRAHYHWSRRVWSPVYSRYQYYEPALRAWYFYDPIRIGYYRCR